MPNQHVLSSFQRTCQPRDRHRDRLRPPSAAPKQQMATPEMVELANRLADEAAKVTTRYFRCSLDVEGKSDESPVTIADREAEQVMRDLILEECPDHGVFGEEMGLSIGTEAGSSYLWVFDPIDGTKSFITGKPLFGTLVSLLYDGEPILGIIDQPILKERWVGIKGRPTTLNGEPISTLQGRTLAESYLYATTPHMFSGATEDAFVRVRDQARIPLYGCDCYAYGLLAAGHCNVVMEADLKPYDYMALVPVVEGAGGVITNWAGQELRWRMTPDTVDQAVKFSGEVLAASDRKLHSEVLRLIGWASPG